MNIQLRGITKRYPGHTAVETLDLDIAEGETLALIGGSGSGKTTTLRMINRLIEPDSGSIRIGGQDIRTLDPPALRRRTGYVIQQTGLFPHLTVQDNMAVVPRLLGWPPAQIQRRIHLLCEALRIDPAWLRRYPAQLSGGQQQRAGLARALAADPPVVLMDEPFGALDPLTREDIREEFRQSEVLRGKTIVLVTHDIQEAFTMGRRIALMDQGRLLQCGAPQELLFQPASPAVARFFEGQAFGLYLSRLTLGDLLPWLPALPPGPDALPAAPHTSLQQALSLLTRSGGQLRITAASPRTADFQTLLHAAGQYRLTR
ncbi:MAG: ATP-binding cassette domain-containing protein [Bacteroidia bacterium]|nr:ATP-binding cassette domain-containing protein [Bacteroidia bacterium]